MNFERFKLASYFQGDSHDSAKVSATDTYVSEENVSTNGISDWGIEETLSNSSHYPSTNFHSYHKYVPTPSFTGRAQIQDAEVPAIPCTTENFQKFIKKYLGLKLNGQFHDKVKYNLIVSNLLDSSMILSRNESSLNGILANGRASERRFVFVKSANPDGTSLVVTKNYQLKFPPSYRSNPHNILITVNLVIYLLKRLKYGGQSPANLKLFKILLIISSKLIKFHRIHKMILFNTTLNVLQEFLVQNLKFNKKVILNLISLKNAKLFNVTDGYDTRYGNLNRILDLFVFNLRYTITTLLPMTNGPNLEKYFNINQIELGAEDVEEENSSHPNAIELLVAKINKLNNLRKLLICILLTLEDTNESSFFLVSLMDRFGAQLSNTGFISTICKLNVLNSSITKHSKTAESFNEIFDDFELLNKSNAPPEENEDILKLNKTADVNSNSNFTQLVNKVSNLSTNLKFFDKYNQSTYDNKGEIYEKLEIFKQFKEDLRSINELYKLNLQDLNYQSNDDDFLSNSSYSNSNRNSTNSEFNLKSFHTKHGRKSGQLSQLSTLQLQQFGFNEQMSPGLKSPDSEYKRTSGPGLKVSLLTVMEDVDGSKSSKTKKREDFNQFTLDQLSKRKVSRFSVNSLNSNISGLSDIVTSQTTLDEEDTNCMSKDELKSKLEESLNRLYNLESQVKLQQIPPNGPLEAVSGDTSLQGSTLTNTSTREMNLAGPDQTHVFQENMKQEDLKHDAYTETAQNNPISKSFLESLETSLDSKLSIQNPLQERDPNSL